MMLQSTIYSINIIIITEPPMESPDCTSTNLQEDQCRIKQTTITTLASQRVCSNEWASSLAVAVEEDMMQDG